MYILKNMYILYVHDIYIYIEREREPEDKHSCDDKDSGTPGATATFR